MLSCFTNSCFNPDLDEAYALAQTKELISVIQDYHLNLIATFTLIEVCHNALNIRIKRLHEDISFIQVL